MDVLSYETVVILDERLSYYSHFINLNENLTTCYHHSIVGKYYILCVQIVWLSCDADWHHVPWKPALLTSDFDFKTMKYSHILNSALIQINKASWIQQVKMEAKFKCYHTAGDADLDMKKTHFVSSGVRNTRRVNLYVHILFIISFNSLCPIIFFLA